MNTFHQSQNLQDIYPDIQGQLCTKHSVHLNKIQKIFNKKFPMTKPSHFVIVKAKHTIIQSDNQSIQMAMQQGVITLFNCGNVGQSLSIQSNFQNQLTLSSNGKIVCPQNISNIHKLISQFIQIGVQDLSLKVVRGGCIYIDLHQGLSLDQNINSICISIFLSILTINNQLQQYDVDQLVQKLKNHQRFKNNLQVQMFFYQHKNRSLSICSQLQINSIELDKKYKFIFIQNNILTLKGTALQNTINNNQYQNAISLFSKGTLSVLDLVKIVSDIQNKTISKEHLDICENIKQMLKLKEYIISGKYTIFLVQTYRYTQIIAKISKIIHQLSFNQQQNTNDIFFNNSKSSNIKIKNGIFTSVPSKGIAIINLNTMI